MAYYGVSVEPPSQRLPSGRLEVRVSPALVAVVTVSCPPKGGQWHAKTHLRAGKMGDFAPFIIVRTMLAIARVRRCAGRMDETLSKGVRREITKKYATESSRALTAAVKRNGPARAVKCRCRSLNYGYDTATILIQVLNLAGRPSAGARNCRRCREPQSTWFQGRSSMKPGLSACREEAGNFACVTPFRDDHRRENHRARRVSRAYEPGQAGSQDHRYPDPTHRPRERQNQPSHHLRFAHKPDEARRSTFASIVTRSTSYPDYRRTTSTHIPAGRSRTRASPRARAAAKRDRFR
jgi:hypothetical protein